MWTDPIVDEIHTQRAIALAAHNGNLQKYADALNTRFDSSVRNAGGRKAPLKQERKRETPRAG